MALPCLFPVPDLIRDPEGDGRAKHQCCSKFSSRVCLRAFDDPNGMAIALLLPDQIKPIGQLVPVS